MKTNSAKINNTLCTTNYSTILKTRGKFGVLYIVFQCNTDWNMWQTRFLHKSSTWENYLFLVSDFRFLATEI